RRKHPSLSLGGFDMASRYLSQAFEDQHSQRLERIASLMPSANICVLSRVPRHLHLHRKILLRDVRSSRAPYPKLPIRPVSRVSPPLDRFLILRSAHVWLVDSQPRSTWNRDS